jgi:hypothetical protein
MPPRLKELLERAEAVQTDWVEHRSSDVLLFLPPHLLLSTGRLPHTAILASYQMLVDCTREPNGADRPVLINGERLLNLSADDVASWQAHTPLPRPCPLGSLPELDAALTSALLAADPQLALTYQELDARSERGGAAADLPYGERLGCRSPDELVQSWNDQLERSQAEIDLALLRQQLLDMEQECERQFLTCREAERKLSWHRRNSQQASAQLHRYGDLLQRLRVIQSRVL